MGDLWQQLMVQPLAAALTYLAGFTGSYGWAIVLFTVIIKTALLPLTIQQQHSTRRMQELQPQLQALQRKYGKDKEKLAQEQMRLYKEAKVNPAGGCLPLLIQMPILLGIWQAIDLLKNQEGFAEASGFLWLPNLAQSEQVMWAVGVLPILTVLNVVSQWVQQRMMTPRTTDPQQQMMQIVMQLMPLYIGWLAFTFPAALALYWFMSNLIGIVQQFVITGWGSLVPENVQLPPALRGGYFFPSSGPAAAAATGALDASSDGAAGTHPAPAAPARPTPTAGSRSGGVGSATEPAAGSRRRDARRPGGRR